jgi:hypothetical protein
LQEFKRIILGVSPGQDVIKFLTVFYCLKKRAVHNSPRCSLFQVLQSSGKQTSTLTNVCQKRPRKRPIKEQKRPTMTSAKTSSHKCPKPRKRTLKYQKRPVLANSLETGINSDKRGKGGNKESRSLLPKVT